MSEQQASRSDVYLMFDGSTLLLFSLSLPFTLTSYLKEWIPHENSEHLTTRHGRRCFEPSSSGIETHRPCGSKHTEEDSNPKVKCEAVACGSDRVENEHTVGEDLADDSRKGADTVLSLPQPPPNRPRARGHDARTWNCCSTPLLPPIMWSERICRGHLEDGH